jgi:hypothetical protein
VLASGNAIGTPALLPDGSVSQESVLASTPGYRETFGVREEPGDHRELPPGSEDSS